ncbi:hypothetical protein H4582DRAFT_1909767 [Lactarius indigo]|nr:hypothetical protein H4582DRAFT_1909767 [Lactarius indigo]
MPTGVVGTEPHYNSEDDVLTSQEKGIRYRILEIDKACADFRAKEYRKLLERLGDGVGQAGAELAGGQRPRVVASSSSRSAPANATTSGQLSGPTSQRQQPHQPSLVERQNDGDRERQLRTLTLPDLPAEPPQVERHAHLENGEAFDGIIAALCADNSARSHDRAAIFGAAGLRDYRLAPREAVWARKTPRIAWRTFTNVFGGSLHAERPTGRRVLGYVRNMICAGKLAQPFAPAHIGEPGVLFFLPNSDTTALLENRGFHVLVDLSERKESGLEYCGIYTRLRIPNQEVQVGEWHALPKEYRSQMLTRLYSLRAGDIHARCGLRKRLGPDSNLSPAMIEEWKRNYLQGSEEVVTLANALRPSFDHGHEVCS